jgi:hypothetical protein
MTTRRNYLLPVLLRTAKLPLVLAPFQYVDMRDPRMYSERLKEVVARIAPEATEWLTVIPSTGPPPAGKWVTAYGPPEYDEEGDAYAGVVAQLEERLSSMAPDDPKRPLVERRREHALAVVEYHESLKEEPW